MPKPRDYNSLPSRILRLDEYKDGRMLTSERLAVLLNEPISDVATAVGEMRSRGDLVAVYPLNYRKPITGHKIHRMRLAQPVPLDEDGELIIE